MLGSRGQGCRWGDIGSCQEAGGDGRWWDYSSGLRWWYSHSGLVDRNGGLGLGEGTNVRGGSVYFGGMGVTVR